MALVQIEEAELLQQKGVIDTLNKMLGNPAARRKVLEARKITDPQVSIPELDAAEPLNGALDEIRKSLAADKAERAAEKAEAAQQRQLDEFNAKLDRQRATLRAHGWTDEGLDQVMQHAQERAIPDLEVAAAHYEKLHPPAEPVSPNGSGSWGFFDQPPEEDTFLKSMIETQGNSEAALDREIQKALAETRGAGRR
jgi:hypothetical protein